MATPPPPAESIVLYGAEGCHLCDAARAVAVAHLASRTAANRRVADLVDVDIHTDERLARAFLETIPVLSAGGIRLELATSPSRIRAFLDAALDQPATEAAEPAEGGSPGSSAVAGSGR